MYFLKETTFSEVTYNNAKIFSNYKVFYLSIMYTNMKFNLFNILVIVLFVLILSSATMVSCANFKPHYADNVFEKHSQFEGFKNNNQMLDYSSKEQHAAMDTNKQHLIATPPAECKKVFGFDGLFCSAKDGPDAVDKIGSAKGRRECVGKSSGLTNSMGGLCLDENQVKLLSTRGGNMSSDVEGPKK